MGLACKSHSRAEERKLKELSDICNLARLQLDIDGFTRTEFVGFGRAVTGSDRHGVLTNPVIPAPAISFPHSNRYSDARTAGLVPDTGSPRT